MTSRIEPKCQYHLKIAEAKKTSDPSLYTETNGDINNIPNARANQSKAFYHYNNVVDLNEYKKLVRAVFKFLLPRSCTVS